MSRCKPVRAMAVPMATQPHLLECGGEVRCVGSCSTSVRIGYLFTVTFCGRQRVECHWLRDRNLQFAASQLPVLIHIPLVWSAKCECFSDLQLK